MFKPTHIGLLILALVALAPLGSARAEGWPSLARPEKNPERPGRLDGALIIAIEDYAFVEDVQGARANASDWDRWFEARGVPISRVVVLQDREAVRESIIRQAGQLAAEMPEGGTLWVVYIGHGAPASDGQDGVLVGADAQQRAEILYARSVGRRELVATLSPGRQAQAVLVLDACFSGKTTTGAPLVPGLQPLIPVALTQADRMTVLTAGAGNEFAGGLPGTQRPAFSYLTLGALHGWREADDDGDGAVSLGEAVGYSRGALRRVATDRRQTPEIAGPLVGLKVARAGAAGPDLRGFEASVERPRFGEIAVSGAGSVAEQLARLEAEQAERDRLAVEAAKERARVEAENIRLAEEAAKERARLEAALRETVNAAAAATQTRAKEEWTRLAKLVSRDFEASRPAVEAFIAQYQNAKVTVDGRGYPIDVPEVEAAKQVAAGRPSLGETRFRPALVAIPAGSYRQGSLDGVGDPDEHPRRTISLSAFNMMATEVTQAQYTALMGDNPSRFSDCPSCPVETVSWLEAVAFANALSAKEDLTPCYQDEVRRVCTGYRLPTEAEWEYAARAGREVAQSAKQKAVGGAGDIPVIASVTLLDDEPTTNIHFKMAQRYEEKSDWTTAHRTYDQYIKKYGKQKADDLVEAYLRKGKAYQKEGAKNARAAASKEFNNALQVFRKLPEAVQTGTETSHKLVRRAVAEAHFELGEYIYRDFEAVKVRFPDSVLRESLVQKAKLLEDCNRVYSEVLDYKAHDISVGAMFRIGESFYLFAKSLADLPVPENLTVDEKILYRAELDSRAEPLQAKAVEVLSRTLHLAHEIRVHNEWSRKAAAILAKLRPEQFPVPDGAVVDTGRHGSNRSNNTHPVGEKGANAWGLSDMLGNVWEWCEDWYDSEAYRGGAINDPTGPPSGSVRVVRGGSWGDDPIRAADRTGVPPTEGGTNVGFRLVRPTPHP
jgi:formylglycine-generating enzyme required for sulfatase activity